MHRFLNRKNKDTVDDATPGKKTKKGKKGQQTEPKFELNLATALPASDDFRTSLIMPSLSTRFSMLKEQDDPNSKLGKASDDSVLQPKRQSRLHEFGFLAGGLSDIAEVQSVKSTRPFTGERKNSFDSHATDDGGSMMTRSRPGEGNVLFGGRQKVYKITNQGSSRSLGHALYDDEVHLSAFQKLRLEEKDRKDSDDRSKENGMLLLDPTSPVKDTPYSPLRENFDQRRETASSTNSGAGNTRTSTAATSIASQGANSIATSSPSHPYAAAPLSPTELNRSTTKTRRLYDQGLDQHIYDQQSSALQRLNTIQRTRAPAGRSIPPLNISQTRSATNLSDRFNRSSPYRMDSPTSIGPSPGIFSGMDAQSGGSSPIISRPQSPPASPLSEDSEDAQTLNSALQPNDRGKATAMGAFNKPKQAFSEQQYAERMKRLQEERDTSTSKPDNPRKPSLRERAEMEKRKRTEVETHEREQSDASTEKKQAPSAFSVFQSAADHMKSPVASSSPAEKSPESQHRGTFFASPGSSDDEEEALKSNASVKPLDQGRRIEKIPTATGPAPPLFEHPALRSGSNSRLDTPGPPTLRERSPSRPSPAQSEPHAPLIVELIDEPTSSVPDPDVDSPTLGPNNSGLSGLIRQHLRNISNVSSDYGDSNQDMMSPPPETTSASPSLQTQNVGFPRQRQPASESDTPAHSSYSHSNPWDLDDLDNPYYGERDSSSSTSPVDAQRSKPQASSIPRSSNDTAPGERDTNKTHQRGDSTETQDEREAFQRDLAQRQRAIQESLRNNNASVGRSRSGSPAAAPSRGGGLKTALNMLRAKSSHESFATVEAQKQQDAQTKAKRILLGSNSTNASSTSLSGLNDRFHAHDQQLRQKPSRLLQQSEQDAQRELESRNPRSNGRTPPASSRSSSTRNRSSSELSSGRSRSRPGQYRDDLDQAMAEGTGSRSTVFPANISPSVSGFVANPTQPLPTSRPSIDSQGRMRSRSNSKTAAASYFESKHLQPLSTGSGPNGSTPRPSPGAISPHPNVAGSFPVSPRPSPGGPSPGLAAFRPQMSPLPPLSTNNTPPVSGSSTPVAVAFNPNASPQHMTKIGTLRKKSVAKSDISEPTFISTTSVVDLVSLPPGASLKNGIETPPPPVPPINPMRRRFGFGRAETHDSVMQSPQPPFAADLAKTNSSDALSSQTTLPRQRLRKTSSEGRSLHGKSQAHVGTSPAIPMGAFEANNHSPPRPIRNTPATRGPMDGSMF